MVGVVWMLLVLIWLTSEPPPLPLFITGRLAFTYIVSSFGFGVSASVLVSPPSGNLFF
jgi:hypothetical protein